MSTKLTVRVVSQDAKVIGSLVGGCRVEIRDVASGLLLAEGLHLGGSGDTELIMKQARPRRGTFYGTEGTACFRTELELSEPTLVRIEARGPLGYPHALQVASKTTWLIPGEHLEGEGVILELHGFLVEIMEPQSVDTLPPNAELELIASVRLL